MHPMNRREILSTVGTTVLACGLLAAVAARPSTAKATKEIVGSWTLVTADGFGPAPLGSLMFDRDGRFSAIFVRRDIPRYLSNSRMQGTPDDYKSTVTGSVAAFGTYALSGTDLQLHIEGSTFPNWIGTDQKRCNVTVSDTELTYTQPTPSAGGPPAVMVWKRAAVPASAS
jgi:hypothetical protein